MDDLHDNESDHIVDIMNNDGSVGSVSSLGIDGLEMHNATMTESQQNGIEATVHESFNNNFDIRPEERWHGSLDQLARQYRDIAMTSCELHDRAGYGARMKHIIFGLPGPILSIITACIASLWNDVDNIYVIVPLSSLAAIFSSVHSFFDMSAKAQQHWNTSSKYGDIASAVDLQLGRDIDFRTPPDTFLVEIRTKLGNLHATAPQLPGKGFCGCKKYAGKVELPKPIQNASMIYKNVPHDSRHYREVKI